MKRHVVCRETLGLDVGQGEDNDLPPLCNSIIDGEGKLRCAILRVQT